MTPRKMYRPEIERYRGIEVIKWLRSQGHRGIDFDFAGSGKSLTIWFTNSKTELAYIMMWEWSKT